LGGEIGARFDPRDAADAPKEVRPAGATKKAIGKPTAVGKPPLAPVFRGMRPGKPTAAMQAVTESAAEKRKRKVTSASTSMRIRKAKDSWTTTVSLSAGSARPRVAASDVLDEMTESQASATDELNFGDGDSYTVEDEKGEQEVAVTKEKGKKMNKRSANYSEEEDVGSVPSVEYLIEPPACVVDKLSDCVEE
jgi:hypothetical protein